MRRVLLDTHTWLWWQGSDRQLGAGTRRIIVDADTVYLSAASAWEIELKRGSGKLRIRGDPDIAAELARDGFFELPIVTSHTRGVRTLPPLHNDPFDRMLVAQAQVEGLTILTADAQMMRYPVATRDARD